MGDRPFAPPELLAAAAMSAVGDDDLRDAVHLRVMPSLLLGFPLVSFAAYRIRPQLIVLEEVLWRDRDGNLASGDLDAAGGHLTADWLTGGDDDVDVAVQVESDGTLEGTVSLLDRAGDRVIAQVSAEPFIVAGPRVDRIRIEGRASWLQLVVWRVYGSAAIEQMVNQTPAAMLSLPIDGDREWYAGGLGEGVAMDMVRSGAPRRLAPPDRPDGPFSGLTRDDEGLRVAHFAGRIVDQCERMIADRDTFPARVRVEHDEPAVGRQPRQIVDVALASTLLAQAMDPGLGRFLGVVGNIGEPVDEPTVIAVAGLFPIDRALVLPGGRRLADVVEGLPSIVGLVADQLVEFAGARGVMDTLQSTWGDGLSFGCLISLAAAVRPPDRPRLPMPRLGAARWLDGGVGPSSTFRQDFLIDDAPLSALVALGHLADGDWTTCHERIELSAPADPDQRAVAMLLGRTAPRSPLQPTGLVSDAPIPAEMGVRYRLAIADLFGRFGEPAELEVPDPPRPGPPTPAPQVELIADGPDEDEPGLASPGRLIVRVPVTSVAERAAGSLPITAMQFDLQGDTHDPIAIQPPDPGAIGMAEDEFDLPALAVGERRTLRLGGVFIDSAGTSGPVGQVPVTIADRRRPAVLVAARGIVWTSRPGPSPEVELALTWPAPKGVAYRAYLADAKSLGLPGATRAAVAKAGGDRDEAGTLGSRDRFRLLTEPPVEAGPGGRVTMVELLPRSLESVQFLRIVPVTAGGREAEFDRCPVIPVAVPVDARPPAPRVRADVGEAAARARIRIEATGLDLVALRAAEPGLFTSPPAADALTPEFRLRRAAGPISDPLYAPEVARGPLVRSEEDGAELFVVELEDPHELAPFVRYSYWAEVRMPAERRLVRGADVEIPPAGGVGPANPAQIADAAGAFSLPSAPSTILGPAGEPIVALDGAAASLTSVAGSLRMSLAAPSTPAAHPLAGPGYRLRIWERWGSGDLTPAGPDVVLSGGALAWEGTPHVDTPAARPAAVVYAVVDPLGTVGLLQELAAPLVTFEPLGGLFKSAPAVCAQGPGRLAAFGIGLDQRLYWRRFEAGAWSPGWDIVAMDLITGPTAVVALGDGSIVVATRADEDPRSYRFDGTSWASWPPAGWFTTGTALVATGSSTAQVFGTRYRRLWSATWQNGAWSAWQRLPGDALEVQDVAAAAGDGRVDLVARGFNGRLHHRALTGGTWGPWTTLGDFTAPSAPALARFSPTEVVVLAQGADQRLHWNRVRAAGPTGWVGLGTAPIAGAPAATTPAPGRVDVFVWGTDRAMHHRWYNGTWHP